MRKNIFILLFGMTVLNFSCSGTPHQHIKVIEIAEKYAEDHCLQFSFNPDENYVTISKYENFNIFKNHYLFEVMNSRFSTKVDSDWNIYLSSEAYFDSHFGWLKKEYAGKSFWGISSLQQKKIRHSGVVSENWGWVFVDDRKMQAIKDPKVDNVQCDFKNDTKTVSPKQKENDIRNLLFQAVNRRDVSKLNELLKRDIVLVESDVDQLFGFAIYQGNKDIILSLLNKFNKIEHYHIKNAIYCRDSLVVEEMLAKHKVFTDEQYFELVNEALMLMEHDIVKVLIKYWSSNKFGSYPLQYYLSILATDREAIEKFISDPEFGVNYSFEVSRDDFDSPVIETPFWLALKNGNMALAIYFFKKGAEVDFRNEELREAFLTLLFQTCSFSEQEIRQLIDYIQKSGVSVENWGIDIIWWNIFNQRKPSCDVSK